MRPNWLEIYIYGCKIYVLNPARAKTQNRVIFKTNFKFYIGYLIGYKTIKIYYIWVPFFDKIIISRNVCFNKFCFYKKPEQKVKKTGKFINKYKLLINIIYKPNLELLNINVTKKLNLL